LADIAIQTARVARRMGHSPRVALISFSNFGQPPMDRSSIVREAVEILDTRNVDFEYEGEMGVDVALNPDVMARYPFCRLSEPANVLIMPGLHSSQTSTKLARELGDCTVIGPILLGLPQSAQIVSMGASVTEMVNLAVIAAHESGRDD